MDSGLEALRQGGYGPAQAASLYWKPWGFRLEQLQPRVHIWHGEDDLNAPFGSNGKVFAWPQALFEKPGCRPARPNRHPLI